MHTLCNDYIKLFTYPSPHILTFFRAVRTFKICSQQCSSIQYIFNYSHHALQYIFRIYSSCLTEPLLPVFTAVCSSFEFSLLLGCLLSPTRSLSPACALPLAARTRTRHSSPHASLISHLLSALFTHTHFIGRLLCNCSKAHFRFMDHVCPQPESKDCEGGFQYFM